ncbi:hypothetical protein DPMN_179458 [Dreissena polymorpha]|uniref:Uncharacterized protein n=1 Tax=Dreissena polymorpha TaxID=45954 RepID=A0A9D4EH28_DREPO|nr:hypothetical protein DPMN_179458 [Dreissena polymorpha]
MYRHCRGSSTLHRYYETLQRELHSSQVCRDTAEGAPLFTGHGGCLDHTEQSAEDHADQSYRDQEVEPRHRCAECTER